MVSSSRRMSFTFNIQHAGRRALSWLIPLCASGVMLVASVLPWLNIPLGNTASAWDIAIGSGWPGHSALLSYGMLCLVGAFSLAASGGWKVRRGSTCTGEDQARWRLISGLLCLAPVMLFVFQIVCVNVSTMSMLAHNETQQLLIQQHFGYTLPPPFMPLQPFTLTASTLGERVQLLLAQLSFGPLLLCASACVLLTKQRWSNSFASLRAGKVPASARLAILLGSMLVIVLAGRALFATMCNDEAWLQLSSGGYDEALHWLSLAAFFNPELEQAAYFHRERGQALYYLAPSHLNADSRLYLAASYRAQHDYLDAYQQLLAARQASPTAPWIIDDLDSTLERLSEDAQPLQDTPGKRLDNDKLALHWLTLLLHVDPANVYAHYMAARITCELHDDRACIEHMMQVLHLSSNRDIASSAYTYLALSANEEGDVGKERALLLTAVALDPGYRNNIAREELSGLH